MIAWPKPHFAPLTSCLCILNDMDHQWPQWSIKMMYLRKIFESQIISGNVQPICQCSGDVTWHYPLSMSCRNISGTWVFGERSIWSATYQPGTFRRSNKESNIKIFCAYDEKGGAIYPLESIKMVIVEMRCWISPKELSLTLILNWFRMGVLNSIKRTGQLHVCL